MRFLVTGSRGFAGRHLVRHLRELEHEVLGLGRLHSDETGGEETLECDLLDYVALLSQVRRFQPDAVVHLAGRTHPRESFERPREYLVENLRTTVHLLEALRESGLQSRILLVSSGEVYRPSPDGLAVSEDFPLEPASPYACSKLLAEQAALQFHRSYATDVVIARSFNHFGPGQGEGFVLADFCAQVARLELERRPPERAVIRVGNLEAVRDFTDVRDVVRAYRMLVERGAAGQCYNVGSGRGIRIRELLEAVLEQAAIRVGVATDPSRVKPGRDRDVHVSDNTLIRKATGWRPRIPLEQTLKDTLETFRTVRSD